VTNRAAVRSSSAAAFVAACWATACAQLPPPGPPPSPPPMAPLTLEAAVQAALADASRRTGLAIDALQLKSAAAVTWRDGSLGCPQPGRVYTQALVPGFRVLVGAAGQTFDYRGGRSGDVSLCPAERAQEPLPDDRRR
jgi:hypothetical protein